MDQVITAHHGIDYGDGYASADIAAGQLVKLSGADTFAPNTGSSALNTPSFGIALKDCKAGYQPTIFVAGIRETTVFEGENLQPGDGLYCSANGKLVGGYDDANEAVKATVDIGTGDALITYEAVDGGTAGNSITVRHVVSGNDTPLSVSVSSLAVTVNVATGAAGAATSTAAEIVAAVNASSTAKVLVRASASGTGVVAAASATNLAGGAAKALIVGRVISVIGGLLKFRLFG